MKEEEGGFVYRPCCIEACWVLFLVDNRAWVWDLVCCNEDSVVGEFLLVSSISDKCSWYRDSIVAVPVWWKPLVLWLFFSLVYLLA